MAHVSVIIPAYNQARYLGQALQSLLDQTYPDWDAIVVDDGSTDETAQVAQGFHDPRMRYVFQSNRGLSAARNTGLRHSSAPLVTFLDADDIFLPAKLGLLTAALERQPELGLVAGQAVLIDEEGRPTGQPFVTRLPADSPLLALANPLHVGSVLLRRDWQAAVGYFDENLRSYEDWDLWLRLALAGCQMGTIEEPVSGYRFHSAQMTRDGGQMTTATFAVLDKLYANGALPADWTAVRERAYAQAHLRAAAQCYVARRFEQGQEHLRQAARLNPALLAEGARPLAQHFAAWIELPKTGDPIAFLDHVYRHLPPEFGALRRRRRQELAQAAMRIAYRTHGQGRPAQARAAVWQALRYQPGWLANRGALAILVRSYLAGR